MSSSETIRMLKNANEDKKNRIIELEQRLKDAEEIIDLQKGVLFNLGYITEMKEQEK